MGNDSAVVKCFFCATVFNKGNGTKMSMKDHALFPRHTKTIKDIITELMFSLSLFDSRFDGVELVQLIGEDDEICRGCLERVAECRLKQLTMEMRCAIVMFNMRKGTMFQSLFLYKTFFTIFPSSTINYLVHVIFQIAEKRMPGDGNGLQ